MGPPVAITLSLFPHEWKTARVIPLYKNGQRNLPGNYRPISVLPVISKIMERILYDQLYNYLTKFELLSDCQFGFRKFHYTATALLDCTNDNLASQGLLLPHGATAKTLVPSGHVNS